METQKENVISLVDVMKGRHLKKVERKAVMLSLNKVTYEETLELCRENSLSFNAFINHLLILYLEGRLAININDIYKLKG